MNVKTYCILALATSFLIVACKKDDPAPINPDELITTVNYTLTSSFGETVTLSYVDLDGDGGNPAVITGGTLNVNDTYTGTLQFLNESVSPVEDITQEIAEEALEHQVFFQTDLTGLLIGYSDTDAESNPIGLETTVITTGEGSGNLTITLRHEPDKNAGQVALGDITNAGGSTDVQVTLPVNVE